MTENLWLLFTQVKIEWERDWPRVRVVLCTAHRKVAEGLARKLRRGRVRGRRVVLTPDRAESVLRELGAPHSVTECLRELGEDVRERTSEATARRVQVVSELNNTIVRLYARSGLISS